MKTILFEDHGIHGEKRLSDERTMSEVENKMPDPAEPGRLQELIDRQCNGLLSVDERGELEKLLLRSKPARFEFWDALSLHAELEWHLVGQETSDDLVAHILGEDYETPADRGRRKAILLPAGRFWGIAAALLVCLGGWLLVRSGIQSSVEQAHREPTSTTSTMLGQLTAIVPGSRWSLGKPGGSNARQIERGETVSVDRGAVRLRLPSDTVAQLEAPAVLQLLSLDRVRILRGRMKFDVAKGDEGFTIETTDAEVVDLGTSFSVEVADGGTDVVVFKGEVNLNVVMHQTPGNDKAGPSSKRFRAGEAVRVSSDGTLSRIVNVIPSAYFENGPQELRPALIGSVRDNIAREDLWSFYEVVHCGMREDALAFVDRDHEWNGVSDAGMPKYLIGGDYVKTFNDDKAAADLAIDLVLERPATVFILLDKRISPPQWLMERFTDTGDEIGVDEAWSEFAEEIAERGPGRSVDHTHSIWKLVVREGGIVGLGPNGRLPGTKKRGTRAATNMYGIVAVPLEDNEMH